MERVQAFQNNLRGLKKMGQHYLGYKQKFKSKGQVPHTATQNTVEKEREQKKTKYVSIKQRKARETYRVDKAAINIYR